MDKTDTALMDVENKKSHHFLTFELSRQLKYLNYEADFMFGFYYLNGDLVTIPPRKATLVAMEPQIIAPLWQQAFDWFETKGYYFGLYSDPENNLWSFDIWQLVNEKDPMQFWFESGYVYRRSDIKSPILKKLIEIITKKQ